MSPLYKSTRKFVLFDALVSHGQLLLRADKIDGSDCNVDIIFFDTIYVQLPTHLNSISIHQDAAGKRFGYKNVDERLDKKYQALFEIRSDTESYYVAASWFSVFENNLSFGETSLGVLTYKGREKQIARSSS
jgi:hypothetical protein